LVTLSANFSWKGASPTNQLQRGKYQILVIALSCSIKISALHCFVLSQKRNACDKRMDAGSFHTKKLCSILYSIKAKFYF